MRRFNFLLGVPLFLWVVVGITPVERMLGVNFIASARAQGQPAAAQQVPPGVREVRIFRDGARRIIVPAEAAWDDFFDAPGIDLGERDQPAAQIRESF